MTAHAQVPKNWNGCALSFVLQKIETRVTKNPASKLKAPKITLCPTLPYTREEMIRILTAAEKYRAECPTRGKDNAIRLRALVFLLRYSGVRIGDAISLTSDRVNQNRLFLYTAKTGTPVNTVLPTLSSTRSKRVQE